MCYSSEAEHRLKVLMKLYSAKADLSAFEAVFEARLRGARIDIPRALEANFDEPADAVERRIHALIQTWRSQRIQTLEAELFRQKQRLADAERKLKLKQTKAAEESRRIASSKIQWRLAKLADLKRREPSAADSRIFPFHYAPVVVRVDGQTLLRPMRYHCRPAGKPEFYDRKYPGCYNARRDNLLGFWKGQFGRTHAILTMTSFYENVARHDFERRALAPGEPEQNLVLHFHPQPPLQMPVACLWSHWEAEGQPSLDSFTAITDAPPPEVAATGHDRCVVVLTSERVPDWLDPSGRSLQVIDAWLEDRPQLVYAHRRAA